jgi:predicted Zn-dependent protease
MPLLGWLSEEVQYVAERGYRLYSEGRLREAAILFKGLVVVDPGNAYCRKALAAISISLGEHGLAARQLSHVLARDPLDVDALARRCETLMAAGDLAAARRDLDALAALPTGVEHARRLGMWQRATSE